MAARVNETATRTVTRCRSGSPTSIGVNRRPATRVRSYGLVDLLQVRLSLQTRLARTERRQSHEDRKVDLQELTPRRLLMDDGNGLLLHDHLLLILVLLRRRFGLRLGKRISDDDQGNQGDNQDQQDQGLS